MATAFGNTWWGHNWLRALTQIDYQNRIPRGASYARKGAVRDVSVKQGYITAKVQGSRLRPYSVSIAMPWFEKDSVDKLMDGIMEHPEIVSKLLKHELDPLILGNRSRKRCRPGRGIQSPSFQGRQACEIQREIHLYESR